MQCLQWPANLAGPSIAALAALIGSVLGSIVSPALNGRQRKQERRRELVLEVIHSFSLLTGEMSSTLNENPQYSLQATWLSRFYAVTGELRVLLPSEQTEQTIKGLEAVISVSEDSGQIEFAAFDKARRKALGIFYGQVFG